MCRLASERSGQEPAVTRGHCGVLMGERATNLTKDSTLIVILQYIVNYHLRKSLAYMQYMNHVYSDREQYYNSWFLLGRNPT